LCRGGLLSRPKDGWTREEEGAGREEVEIAFFERRNETAAYVGDVRHPEAGRLDTCGGGIGYPRAARLDTCGGEVGH